MEQNMEIYKKEGDFTEPLVKSDGPELYFKLIKEDVNDKQ